MAQKRKGPRLLLHRRRGRRAVWSIRYLREMVSTGFGEADREKAEQALRSYAAAIDAGIDRTEPASTAASTIYFITCDAPEFPIKIGITSDVDARIAGLRTALPFPVVLLCAVSGTRADERRIQLGFAADRLEGEWFRRTPSLLDYIERRLDLERHYRAVPIVSDAHLPQRAGGRG